MEFRYILNKEEIYRALKETGYIKTTGKRAVWETVVLIAVFTVFFVFYCINGDERNLFFAVISAVFGAVVWIVPEFLLRRKAKSEAENGSVFSGSLEENALRLTCNGETLLFPLNRTCFYRECGSILLLYTIEKKLAVFPLRSIAEEDREQFLKKIRGNFKPYSEA